MSEDAHPLSGLLEKVTGKEERQSSPMAFILAAIAAIGLAVVGFLLMRARRKAAILAQKLRITEEGLVQVQEARKLAENNTEREVASTIAFTLEGEIQELQEALRSLEDANLSRRKAIAGLSDWDDLVVKQVVP